MVILLCWWYRGSTYTSSANLNVKKQVTCQTFLFSVYMNKQRERARLNVLGSAFTFSVLKQLLLYFQYRYCSCTITLFKWLWKLFIHVTTFPLHRVTFSANAAEHRVFEQSIQRNFAFVFQKVITFHFCSSNIFASTTNICIPQLISLIAIWRFSRVIGKVYFAFLLQNILIHFLLSSIFCRSASSDEF